MARIDRQKPRRTVARVLKRDRARSGHSQRHLPSNEHKQRKTARRRRPTDIDAPAIQKRTHLHAKRLIAIAKMAHRTRRSRPQQDLERTTRRMRSRRAHVT